MKTQTMILIGTLVLVPAIYGKQKKCIDEMLAKKNESLRAAKAELDAWPNQAKLDHATSNRNKADARVQEAYKAFQQAESTWKKTLSECSKAQDQLRCQGEKRKPVDEAAAELDRKQKVFNGLTEIQGKYQKEKSDARAKYDATVVRINLEAHAEEKKCK